MISGISSSSSSNPSVTADIKLAEPSNGSAPPPEPVQKKVSPQGYISYASLKESGVGVRTQTRSASAKDDKSRTFEVSTSETEKKVQDEPAPEGRTVGAVTGRVVGYDENFNPITEEELKASASDDELANQKVDNAEASRELSAIMDGVVNKPRINQEFYAYLDKKYGNTARPPDGMDVYINPQNYSPEQKLARYLDLVRLKGQFTAYRDARQAPHTGMSKTIKTEPEIDKDIQNAMDTLLEDPATAGLLSSEYLYATKEILGGARFQDDPKKYDQSYTDSVNELRGDLEKRFEDNIVNGGIFKDGLDRGANVKTILANYNTALNAYGSIFSAEYIEQRQAGIEKSYSEFYSAHVEPLLPDPANGLNRLLYAGLKDNDIATSQQDKIGLVTPTVDGMTYGNLGLELETTGLTTIYDTSKIDDATRNEIKSLGLDPAVLKGGFEAAFLPSIKIIADQVFGVSPAKKADRAAFMTTLFQELRPLVAKFETKGDANALNNALDAVRTRLDKVGGTTALHSDQAVTALEGLVRGTVLARYQLTKEMINGGGLDEAPGLDLEYAQKMTTLAVGYEGRGLAADTAPYGESLSKEQLEKSPLAKTVFGTENRMWDSSVLQRFGTEKLQPYSNRLALAVRTILPNSMVRDPVYDMTSQGREAIDGALKKYAEAVAKGIYGDDVKAVDTFASNLVRFTYSLWSIVKPGGNSLKLYQQAKDLSSTTGGAFSTGEVSVSDHNKSLAKWGTAFIGGTRAIQAGFMNQGKFDGATIAAVTLHSAAGMAQMLDLVSFSIQKNPMDSRTLALIGEYGDAAKQFTKTTAGKAAGTLSGLIDIAWLPLDIFSFVQGLKNGKYDTTEKIFQGIMIATDVGIAVDGGLTLAKTLIPASVLQTSRLAFLFSGTGAAVTSVLGAAFNLANFAVLIFLNLWQDKKMEKEFKKAGQELDYNLGRLVDDNVTWHLTDYFFPEVYSSIGDDERIKQKNEDNKYKTDITPFDWVAVRANNRARYEQAAA